MAIHPHTHNLPLREVGILTVLPVADGEADDLPSLLPEYSTTPQAPCQEEFFTFFLYFHRKQASKLGFIELFVRTGGGAPLSAPSF